MGYTHFTKDERYQIRAIQKMESSTREMADVLNRSPSRISRELRRNRGQRGYRPRQADQKACERARTSRTRARITAQDWAAYPARRPRNFRAVFRARVIGLSAQLCWMRDPDRPGERKGRAAFFG